MPNISKFFPIQVEEALHLWYLEENHCLSAAVHITLHYSNNPVFQYSMFLHKEQLQTHFCYYNLNLEVAYDSKSICIVLHCFVLNSLSSLGTSITSTIDSPRINPPDVYTLTFCTTCCVDTDYNSLKTHSTHILRCPLILPCKKNILLTFHTKVQ